MRPRGARIMLFCDIIPLIVGRVGIKQCQGTPITLPPLYRQATVQGNDVINSAIHSSMGHHSHDKK